MDQENQKDHVNLPEVNAKEPSKKVSFSRDSQEVTMTDPSACDLSPEEVLLAATLIKDAKNSRHMQFKTDEKSLKSYLLFQHWILKSILHVFLWANMALAIFEEPAVPGVKLPYWATIIMEVCFLSYFLFRFIHHMSFEEPKVFWKDPKNLTVLIIIILTFLDMLGYIIWVQVAVTTRPIRWSRPLRPFLMVNFPEGRQTRKALRNIRKTLPDIFHVLVLFLCSLAIFALMALKLLQKRGLTYPNQSPYFQDYFEAYWDLYVLVTTANNPDVMMPAYDHNRLFSLFFILFSIVNQYIFMSIVLASVYNNYKRHLKEEVRTTVYMKRGLLGRAFDVMKVKDNSGKYVVTKARWTEVMKVAQPHRSETQTDLLHYVLDEDCNGNIEKKQFMQVAELLNVKLTEIKDRMTMLEKKCPGCYTSKPSEWLQIAVRHKVFRFFFDFAILVNAICIGLSLEQAEWFFLGLFTLEIVLKMYTYGPVKFFRSAWNIFDFIVILAAALATLIETINGHYAERGRTLDFILVLRVLRLVRLIGSIESVAESMGLHLRFQIIITTVVNIGPSILTYGSVLFVLYYVYAIIGMECFSNVFNYKGYYNNDTMDDANFCNNTKLKGSEFAIKRYCNNNFNDIQRSFVLLFELMVVNQWHVLTLGFELVAHKAVRVFFISFHMICVTLLLNIFTAFVLEVFLLEYSLCGNALEESIEAKIKDMGLSKGMTPVGRRMTIDKVCLVEDGVFEEPDSPETAANNNITPPQLATDNITELPPPGVDDGAGRYFKLKRKTKKRLEELLQAMFQSELDAELATQSEQVDTTQQPQVRARRLTLETVDA